MSRALEISRHLRWRNVVGTTRAAVCLCRVAFRLRRSSLPRLLDALRLRDDLPVADDARVERAAQWVRWAHRLLPLNSNCLLDSLTTAAVVRQQGFSVPFRIGVNQRDGVFQAHAWLGETAPQEASDFQILFGLPAETKFEPGRGPSAAKR